MPRRPTDFKRGIVPDGLVQSKLAGVMSKFPELRKLKGGRGDKRKCGVENLSGVPNVG